MVYLETCFLVPLFIPESASALVSEFMARPRQERLATSPWAGVEFSSTLARRQGMQTLGAAETRSIELEFDRLLDESVLVLPLQPQDLQTAREFLRAYKTGLRAGDALHLAVAANRGATEICSLDADLNRAGKTLGLPMSQGLRMNRG